jgi:transcriptional regulator with XRE-family HTH domain
MVKPTERPYSHYSLDALAMLGQLVREARLSKGLRSSDLAIRAGISRALLQRIERGDPSCSIGAVFEVATICGVPLFEPDPRRLGTALAVQREKMALLPKSVRIKSAEIKDDF